MINIKKLLLTGIIGFVGFLGFSNAGVIREVGIFGYSPYDNNMALAVNVKGQLLSEKGQVMRDMLFVNDNHNNDNGRAFFFWTYTGYPYMYKCVRGSCYEGVPYAYKLCDELTEAHTNGPTNCGDWVYFDDESQEYMDSFLSTIQNNDLYYFNSTYRVISVAFSSSQISKSILFGFSIDNTSGGDYLCNSCIITGSSLGFGSAIDYASFNDSYLGQSPGVGAPAFQTGDVSSDYERPGVRDMTNQDAIDGLEARGLSEGFCYGGFPIDNIFQSSETPESFVGYRRGTGASIFDLWNIYSGDFENDYIAFLRTYYTAYYSNSFGDFYGKPKALYSIINQIESVDISSVGFANVYNAVFTIVDLREYCDLVFYSDRDAKYTGDNWEAIFGYKNQPNVDLSGRFDFSGNNLYFSGALSGFDEPSDFFGSMIGIFQNGLGNLGGNNQPVLPVYIIVFMLAIIFIRIISH